MGDIFGRGVCFAESAPKSMDQSASRSTRNGKLTLTIGRVCLGRCKMVTNAQRRPPFFPEVAGVRTAVPSWRLLRQHPGRGAACASASLLSARTGRRIRNFIVEYERVWAAAVEGCYGAFVLILVRSFFCRPLFLSLLYASIITMCIKLHSRDQIQSNRQ